MGSGDSDSGEGGETYIIGGSGGPSGGTVNIKAGHSSSGDRGGSFRAEAGSGGEVRILSGPADVSGAVSLESGAGGVESENIFPCMLGFLLSTRQ